MDIPEMYKKVACVYSEDNFELSQKTNELLQISGKYLAVFNFPKVLKGKNEEISFGDDFYINEIVGGSNSIFIRNSLVRLDPEFIVLVGMTSEQKSFFNYLPKDKVFYIDSENDLEQIKKLENKKLTSGKKEHLIICEGSSTSESLVAKNLSNAINAEIIYIPKTDRHIHTRVSKYLYECKGDRKKYASYVKLKNLVHESLFGIDCLKYKTITCFTHGIPYGYLLDNKTPFCYIPKTRAGIFILNSIIYSQKSFNLGMVFSIDEFLREEPWNVVEIFKKAKISPVGLFLEKANSFNLTNYISYIPFDILHIASHGGRARGYHVTEKFKDRMGENHEVEYYEVPSFSHSPIVKEGDDKNIIVERKTIFLKFNGLRWMSKELKEKGYPSYVFEDMRKEVFDGRLGKDAKRTPVEDDRIQSYVISCNNGSHQGFFNVMAGHNSPIVFNNSCWSWVEVSSFFLFSGTRAYIGTLWEVNSLLAKKVSEDFYKKILLENKTIPFALWEVTKDISQENQKGIYACWSTPFNKINRNVSPTPDNLIESILENLMGWIIKVEETKIKEVSLNPSMFFC